MAVTQGQPGSQRLASSLEEVPLTLEGTSGPINKIKEGSGPAPKEASQLVMV